MRKRTIPKESTTLGYHESFLSENHTMNERANHPQLEMLVDCLLEDGVFRLATMVMDLSIVAIMGLWETIIQKVVVVVF